MNELDELDEKKTELSPAKILLVDDEASNRKMMAGLMEHYGYIYETAENGIEALTKCGDFQPDLVLMDILMPGLDGLEAIKRLKNNPATKNIPVVLVTALDDRESRIKGLEAGASDYLSKPIDRSELIVRVRNLLKIKEYEDFILRYNTLLEDQVNRKTEKLKKANEAMTNLNASLKETQLEIKESYMETVRRLTIVAEYKDEETSGHIKRICNYAKILSKELALPKRVAENLFFASPMHDIGKIAIPSEILLKTSRLTNEEFALMKTHSDIGSKILGGSQLEFLQVAERIARTHHERWDGGGYPKGLKGEEIPIEGRIMIIIDQYDALRGKRPYKPSLNHETVYKIITEGDGRTMPRHFDPKVLTAFKNVHKELEAIFDGYALQ
jgi:putative two-component system response regulator